MRKLLLLPLLLLSLEAKIPVNQWVGSDYLQRRYPEGLTSLLQAMNQVVGSDFNPSVQYLEGLNEDVLRSSPFLYINAGDIKSWPTQAQCKVLRSWVEHGGFLWIDAGLQASFLQESAQNHSYAAWDVAEPVAKFLKMTFGKLPEIVPSDHEIFHAWYTELPDPKDIPEGIRDYVTKEKWPSGSYSTMGIKWGTEFRVVLTPIISMGWGRDLSGTWSSPIAFRVREYDSNAETQLKSTVAKGKQYEVPLLNNQKEFVYCETGDMPAWVREPNGRIRLFKYYKTSDISDYAHTFYTRFGINMLYYGLASRH